MPDIAARYINEQQASRFLGVSVAFLRKRRLLRQPPPFSKCGSRCLYSIEHLDAYAQGHRVAVAEPAMRERRVNQVH